MSTKSKSNTYLIFIELDKKVHLILHDVILYCTKVWRLIDYSKYHIGYY